VHTNLRDTMNKTRPAGEGHQKKTRNSRSRGGFRLQSRRTQTQPTARLAVQKKTAYKNCRVAVRIKQMHRVEEPHSHKCIRKQSKHIAKVVLHCKWNHHVLKSTSCFSHVLTGRWIWRAWKYLFRRVGWKGLANYLHHCSCKKSSSACKPVTFQRSGVRRFPWEKKEEKGKSYFGLGRHQQSWVCFF
jgi:hypothetical protein